MRENIIWDYNADILIKNWEDAEALNEELDSHLAERLERLSWLHGYYDKMGRLSTKMHIRNFNFSVYAAGKYIE